MNSYIHAQKELAGNYFSEKALCFFDYKSNVWEVRALTRVSGIKGKGNVVISENFEHRKLIPVVPESSTKDNLRIACRKK
jgi:hypothetical protein